MTPESIESLKAQIILKGQQLEQSIVKAQQELAGLQQELLRVQGEYRLIEQLAAAKQEDGE